MPAECVVAWLNGNSGAITAIASVGGVLVAAVYTYYTTKLWRVSDRQARNAEVQADTGKRQLELLSTQMAAADRAFESTHRPRLLIDAELETFEIGADTASETPFLTVMARNIGSMPATVLSIGCDISPPGKAVWANRFLPIVVAGGDKNILGRAAIHGKPDAEAPSDEHWFEKTAVWFHVRLSYRGPQGAEYAETAQISICPMVRDRTKWMLFGVTPTGAVFQEIHRKSLESEQRMEALTTSESAPPAT